MATTANDPKQQAHELIDRMPSGQVSAVVGLLQAMLDPVSVAMVHASLDDEAVSDEEVREIASAREALARGELSAHDAVLADFGLTAEDFERMARIPAEPHSDLS